MSPGNSGVPDRIVVLPGEKIGFAEMKRPGETTSALQDVQIAFLQKSGFFVQVLDSEEAIDAFLIILQNRGGK